MNQLGPAIDVSHSSDRTALDVCEHSSQPVFIESVMDHFRYCAGLVGLDHVAFGPDTLHGDHVMLHKIFAHLLSLGATGGPSFEPVEYVDGLENPAENFGNICGWLVRHGFGDGEIRAVLGGNIYRALRDVWIA